MLWTLQSKTCFATFFFYFNTTMYRLLLRPISYYPSFFALAVVAMSLAGVMQDLVWAESLALFPLFQAFGTFAGAVWWAYLQTSVVAWCGRNWLKVVFYVVNGLLMLVNLFLLLNFQTLLSPWVLLLIGETNGQEASEFMSTYLFSGHSLVVYAIMAVYVVMVWFLERVHLQKVGKSLTIFIVLTIPLVIGCLSTAKTIHLFTLHTQEEVEQWFRDKGLFTIDHVYGNLAYSFYHVYVSSAENRCALNHSTMAATQSAVCNEVDSLDVMLVIGESYNKYHASLYGYALPTTPRMDAEQRNGRLFAFNHVTSPYNMTTLAVKNILSTNSLADGEAWSECPAFPVVFRKAGFQVLLWDNQKPENSAAIFDFSLGSYMYADQLAAIAYSHCNEHVFPYDFELVESYFAEAKRDVLNMSIIHLMGQHFDAAQRFPHHFECEVFHAADIARDDLSWAERTAVAQYDNATHYNDSLMGCLFRHLSHRNAVIVYLSDHGEEVYDYRHFIGRSHERNKSVEAKKYQYDIPFIVWCSDKYQQLHPAVMHALAAAKDRPFSSDQTAHLLFTLSAVETSYYKSQCDVLQDNYTTK
jgi:heptose-I-phosphate ethanolaminephosphotransferase